MGSSAHPCHAPLFPILPPWASVSQPRSNTPWRPPGSPAPVALLFEHRLILPPCREHLNNPALRQQLQIASVEDRRRLSTYQTVAAIAGIDGHQNVASRDAL